MKTITPNHGRDYTTPQGVRADYFAGKDFILHEFGSRWDGKPISIRDLRNEDVRIRFDRASKSTIVYQGDVK